jgi:hypothetical protein
VSQIARSRTASPVTTLSSVRLKVAVAVGLVSGLAWQLGRGYQWQDDIPAALLSLTIGAMVGFQIGCWLVGLSDWLLRAVAPKTSDDELRHIRRLVAKLPDAFPGAYRAYTLTLRTICIVQVFGLVLVSTWAMAAATVYAAGSAVGMAAPITAAALGQIGFSIQASMMLACVWAAGLALAFAILTGMLHASRRIKVVPKSVLDVSRREVMALGIVYCR